MLKIKIQVNSINDLTSYIPIFERDDVDLRKEVGDDQRIPTRSCTAESSHDRPQHHLRQIWSTLTHYCAHHDLIIN